MIRVSIHNDAEGTSHPGFVFPTTEHDLHVVLQELGYKPERIDLFRIAEINLAKHSEATEDIKSTFPSEIPLQNVDELNKLSTVMSGLSIQQLEKFLSVCESYQNEITGIPQMLHIAGTLDDYVYLPDVDMIYDMDETIDQWPLSDSVRAEIESGNMEFTDYVKGLIDEAAACYVSTGFVADMKKPDFPVSVQIPENESLLCAVHNRMSDKTAQVEVGEKLSLLNQIHHMKRSEQASNAEKKQSPQELDL